MLYDKTVHKTTILTGPHSSGKSTLARKLAFESNCRHSVIYTKSPTLANISNLLERIKDEVETSHQSVIQNFIEIARKQFPKLQVIVRTTCPMFYLPLSLKYNFWEI